MHGGAVRTFRCVIALRNDLRDIVGEKTEAFGKGGCGCLIAFLIVGCLTLLVGGRVRIDLGGAIILFIIGGVIGLVFLAVFNKGKNSSR